MKSHALNYLRQGYSIIPVSQNKKPFFNWLEYQKRFPTEDEIEKWWTLYPDANIGIVTGKISNLCVVDVEKGGDVSWLPDTAIVQTGGGGYHYYYKYNPIVTNRTRIRELTDIRGEGGFVICPPSKHSSGGYYLWNKKRELAEFPQELLKFFNTNPYNNQNGYSSRDWEGLISGVSSGSRNDSAAAVIGKLLKAFPKTMWETSVWEMVCNWNLKNTPPLPERELRATFQSISRKALANGQGGSNGEVVEKKDFNLNSVKFLTLTDVVDLGHNELKNIDDSQIISFGYDWLDEQLTGIFPGELIVIGSESGGGKTTFSTNIILKASKKVKCAIFALEDRIEDYGIKALYYNVGQIRREKLGKDVANYIWNDFRRNKIKDPMFNNYLLEAKEKIKNDNIVFAKVDELMNIDLLEAVIEEQVKMGVKLFLIDHLHYFDLNSDKMSKADYIEKVMVRIRTLQRRTGASIIMIVHYKKLNGQKPGLDSFKDSISIVQNANYVINIWRDRSMEASDKAKSYETYFYIPKSRNPNGEGIIKISFDPSIGDYPEKQECSVFGDLPKEKKYDDREYNNLKNLFYG